MQTEDISCIFRQALLYFQARRVISKDAERSRPILPERMREIDDRIALARSL